MIKRLSLFILIQMPLFTVAQLVSYSANQLDSLLYQEQKPIVFFITTDWCSICLGMEEKVLKDTVIVNQLNQYFYFVSFNGESKEDIYYKGKRYRYIPYSEKNGIHEFALQFSDEKQPISYPTLAIVYGKVILFKTKGFIEADELLKILQLFDRN